MSEYQYFEFQALDRSLTGAEMGALRRCSSRATITPTRFVNTYEWGDFKGDPSVWMDKYFDAFLYVANWGSREFRLRLPRRLLDPATAKPYTRRDAFRARSKGEFVILEFASHPEEPDAEWDDGSGWLSSLVPVRDALASGDVRALYLGWLSAVQAGGVPDAVKEPPVPPGLGTLTGSLSALAEFLRIDDNLLAVAAARSADHPLRDLRGAVTRFVEGLTGAERSAWLLRLADSEDQHARAELLRASVLAEEPSDAPASAVRTAGVLRTEADRLAQARRKREAMRAEERRAFRARAAAEERERHLRQLGEREPEAWKRVDSLVAGCKPAEYDEAVRLLADLRDLGRSQGREGEIVARVIRLRFQCSRKPSLVARLEKAFPEVRSAQPAP